MALTALLCGSGCYVVRQSLHHNELFNARVPNEVAAEDPGLNAVARAGLREVDGIMRFAASRGLNTGSTYRYIIAKADGPVSYIVQAAHADRLEAYTWWFPIVGSVPYKGFFLEADRNRAAEELRSRGFDVHLGAATAFSSLGWFEDPLFTSMVKRPRYDLAHLLFHELTHRTVWIAGSVEFNEQLAEYVAWVLTVEYLEAAGDQGALARYRSKDQDRRRFSRWLASLKEELERHFSRTDLSPAEILRGKERIYARYQAKPLRPDFDLVDYVGADDWNNASLLAARLYDPDYDRFARARACRRDTSVVGFIQAIETKVKNSGLEPFATLDAMCQDLTHGQAVQKIGM